MTALDELSDYLEGKAEKLEEKLRERSMFETRSPMEDYVPRSGGITVSLAREVDETVYYSCDRCMYDNIIKQIDFKFNYCPDCGGEIKW